MRHKLPSSALADTSLKESDKANWLRIAQKWLRMLGTYREGETAQQEQSRWPAPSDEDSPGVALTSAGHGLARYYRPMPNDFTQPARPGVTVTGQ